MERLREAENIAIDMIKTNPQETRAYILRGRIAEKENRIPEALVYVEKALALEPQNTSLKISYAKFLRENQNYQKAGKYAGNS